MHAPAALAGRLCGTNTHVLRSYQCPEDHPLSGAGAVLALENLVVVSGFAPGRHRATFGGVWLVRRIDATRFYTIVYGLNFGVGLKLICDALQTLS